VRKITIYIFIGLFVTYITSKLILNNDLNYLNTNFNIELLIISVLSYFLSICLRGIRIFLLSDLENKFLSKSISLQIMTSSLQLLLPFRLGDIARFYIFRNYLNNLAESVSVFFIEKTFDLIATLSIILLWLIPDKLKYLPIIFNNNYIFYFISIVFLILIIFSNKSFQNYILKSNSGKEFKAKISKRIFSLSNTVQTIFSRSRKKFFKIIAITFSIWIFDSLSFIFITSLFNPSFKDILLIGPLVALSSSLPSPPLGISGSVAIGFYWTELLTGMDKLVSYSTTYSINIYGSIVKVSILFYCLIKFRNLKFR